MNRQTDLDEYQSEYTCDRCEKEIEEEKEYCNHCENMKTREEMW